MFWLSTLLFVAGLILLVVGYRKDDRNLLLVAAILLLLAGNLGHLVDGFVRGWTPAAGGG